MDISNNQRNTRATHLDANHPSIIRALRLARSQASSPPARGFASGGVPDAAQEPVDNDADAESELGQYAHPPAPVGPGLAQRYWDWISGPESPARVSNWPSLPATGVRYGAGVASDLVRPYLPVQQTPEGGYAPAVPPIVSDTGHALWKMGNALREAYTNEPMAPSDVVPTAEDASLVAALAPMGAMLPKPTSSLGVFGGRLAKTADLNRLYDAEKMTQAEASPRKIWNKTGWFKGVDDKWRFEIDDSKSGLAPTAMESTQQLPLQYRHPELYQAYPELTKSTMGITPLEKGIRSQYIRDNPGVPHFDIQAPAAGDWMRSATLHELQHGVQDIEGFTPGGSPQMFAPGSPMNSHVRPGESLYDAYQRIAGEMEARRVQARADLQPKERSLMHPWWGDEYEPTDQIALNDEMRGNVNNWWNDLNNAQRKAIFKLDVDKPLSPAPGYGNTLKRAWSNPDEAAPLGLLAAAGQEHAGVPDLPSAAKTPYLNTNPTPGPGRLENLVDEFSQPREGMPSTLDYNSYLNPEPTTIGIPHDWPAPTLMPARDLNQPLKNLTHYQTRNRLEQQAMPNLFEGPTGLQNPWYYPDPLLKKWEEIYGEHAPEELGRFLDFNAAVSPLTEVGQGIREASKAYKVYNEGKPFDQYTLGPDLAGPAKGNKLNLARDVAVGNPFNPVTAPKVANFQANLRGAGSKEASYTPEGERANTPITLDSVMAKTWPYRTKEGNQALFKKASYGAGVGAGHDLAERMGGVPGADWQAAVWQGHQKNLHADTSYGARYNDSFARQVETAVQQKAARDGIDQNLLWDQLIRGKTDLFSNPDEAAPVGAAIAGAEASANHPPMPAGASPGSLLDKWHNEALENALDKESEGQRINWTAPQSVFVAEHHPDENVQALAASKVFDASKVTPTGDFAAPPAMPAAAAPAGTTPSGPAPNLSELLRQRDELPAKKQQLEMDIAAYANRFRQTAMGEDLKHVLGNYGNWSVLHMAKNKDPEGSSALFSRDNALRLEEENIERGIREAIKSDPIVGPSQEVSQGFMDPPGYRARVFRGADTGNRWRPDSTSFSPRSEMFWASDNPQVADYYSRIRDHLFHTNADYLNSKYPAMLPAEVNFKNPYIVDAKGSQWSEIPHTVPGGFKDITSTDHLADYAKKRGHDGLVVKNVRDDGPPATTVTALQRGTVKSPLTGETIFANSKEGASAAGLLADAAAARGEGYGSNPGIPGPADRTADAGAQAPGLPNAASLRSGEGELAASGGARDPYAPIPGIPRTAKIPKPEGGHGDVEARPIPWLVDSGNKYMHGLGRQHDLPEAFGPQDKELAKRVAAAFEDMPHDPSDPRVRRSYDAMAQETLDQYKALKDAGAEFRYNKPGEDPYAASPAMGYPELRDRRSLSLFPTTEGYGNNFTPVEIANNPLLKGTSEKISGKPTTVNDIFRAVHDAYGHYAYGNPFFRAPGEERAWMIHSGMYSPEARGAMTTELRGQNNWLNFGPHAEHNRTATAADTIYAPQKIGLLPQWAQEEGRHGISLHEYALIQRALKLAKEREGKAVGGPVLSDLVPSEGYVPDDWQERVVRPMLKPEAEQGAESNWMPVAPQWRIPARIYDPHAINDGEPQD